MTGLRYSPLHVTEFCGEMQGKFKVGRARLITPGRVSPFACRARISNRIVHSCHQNKERITPKELEEHICSTQKITALRNNCLRYGSSVSKIIYLSNSIFMPIKNFNKLI